MSLGLPASIEAKISPGPNSGCWLWTDPLRDGYGRFFDGRRLRSAHRVVYELLCGKIEPGLTLDHLCRVRCCVNPEHLEPVTQKENVRRGQGIAARNLQKTHCKNGHAFTPDNIQWFTYPNGGKQRLCRQCHHEASKRHHAKLRGKRRGA